MNEPRHPGPFGGIEQMGRSVDCDFLEIRPRTPVANPRRRVVNALNAIASTLQ